MGAFDEWDAIEGRRLGFWGPLELEFCGPEKEIVRARLGICWKSRYIGITDAQANLVVDMELDSSFLSRSLSC